MSLSTFIDLDYLASLSGGDQEFEQELLLTFVADAQEHLTAAQAALAGNDGTQIMREAHHLKGSGGNVGANEIHSLASQLETQAKTGNLSAAGPLIDQMQTQCNAIAAALQSMSS